MLKWISGIIAGIVGTIITLYLTDQLTAKVIFYYSPTGVTCVGGAWKDAVGGSPHGIGPCTFLPQSRVAKFVVYNGSKTFSLTNCRIRLRLEGRGSQSTTPLGETDYFVVKPQEERTLE